MIRMLPPKSREHRQRVLENQAKLAAHRAAAEQVAGAAQLNMPLLVEVKCSEAGKPLARRGKRKTRHDQPGFGGL